MNAIDRNGLSRSSDASLLAERLQARPRHGAAARARSARGAEDEDPPDVHRPARERVPQPRGTDELARRVREIVVEELNAEEAPLSPSERADLERQIADDILGYGPLEPFLQDPTRHRGDGQRLRPGLRRAGRQDRGDGRRRSSTTPTCCGSSTASSRRSAGASTSRRRWSTRACRTAAASTRSSRRSRSRGPSLDDPQVRRATRSRSSDLVGLGTLTEQTADFLAAVRARAS